MSEKYCVVYDCRGFYCWNSYLDEDAFQLKPSFLEKDVEVFMKGLSDEEAGVVCQLNNDGVCWGF